MDIDYYKKNYGEVISDEYRKSVSERSKEKWKSDEYRNNTIESRKWIYTDEELQKKRVQSIHKYYENGGKVWNAGLTKDTNEILNIIGNKNRQTLTGRTKDTHDYIKKHSELMKLLWNDSNFKKSFIEMQHNLVKKKAWQDKISNTISAKILSGEINTFSNFKCGWYENDKNKYWYASGLELDSMILMDELNINWSNNHKIRIKYIKDGNQHYFIPDFLITIHGLSYIIEMKGFDWDGDTELKSEYAKKEYDNYHIFYSIEELNKFLNNKINNI
jgi:hypothetical protein